MSNVFQNKYGNITLWEFNNRRQEFKKEYKYIRTLKNYREQTIAYKEFIYGLKMAEYKRDKIWEYLNDDLTDIGLYEFITGVYSGRGGKSDFAKKRK